MAFWLRRANSGSGQSKGPGMRQVRHSPLVVDTSTPISGPVIALSDRFNPGNGICDGLIEAAVIGIEFPVRLTAAINQAEATPNLQVSARAG